MQYFSWCNHVILPARAFTHRTVIVREHDAERIQVCVCKQKYVSFICWIREAFQLCFTGQDINESRLRFSKRALHYKTWFTHATVMNIFVKLRKRLVP